MKPKPANAAKEAPQLTFVNVSDPSESSSGVRRLVRSRATSYSHRDPTRKAKTAANNIIKRRKHDAKTKLPTQGTDAANTDEESSLLVHTSKRPDLALSASKPSDPDKLQLLLLNGGHIDPFDAYSIPAQPWHHWVLDYYRTVHLPPGLAVVQTSSEEGCAYIDWQLREAVSEPSLFYMQLLNACTPLVVEGRIRQEVVIFLRGEVVASINQAIGDPRRALSTATLLTVASIALHERLFGDPTIAIEVHGRAYRQMLAMRGGARSLDVPRICFKLLHFTDSILSANNEHRTTADLLSAWAPENLRLLHPGYGQLGNDETTLSANVNRSEQSMSSWATQTTKAS